MAIREVNEKDSTLEFCSRCLRNLSTCAGPICSRVWIVRQDRMVKPCFGLHSALETEPYPNHKKSKMSVWGNHDRRSCAPSDLFSARAPGDDKNSPMFITKLTRVTRSAWKDVKRCEILACSALTGRRSRSYSLFQTCLS